MEKVRFGERSGKYIQEVDMQELIVKCDVCLKPMETKYKEVSLIGKLSIGKDGGRIINLKDICEKCCIVLNAAINKVIIENRKRE